MRAYKVFDAHTHIYPPAIAQKACDSLGKFYNFDVLGKGTIDDLEEQASKIRCRGGFILGVATNAHQVEKVNSFTAEQAELSRGRGYITYGFGGMHQEYSDFEGEVLRCQKLGLIGIKIHPDIQVWSINSTEMYALAEILEGNMPLFLHMGDERAEYRFSEPKKLERLIKRFPRLEVFASHIGGYKAWDEAQCLAGAPGVWYDCSSALWAMTPERANELFHIFGTDKVMYGTDYPVVNLDTYLELFMKIELTEEERRDILFNNAMRFLGIE